MELWFWGVLGIGAFVFSWTVEKGAIDFARTSRTILFGSHSAARAAVDSQATRLGLAGSEWAEKEGGALARVLYPRARGRDPFQVVVTISADGKATFKLIPEGASRSLLMGFIPLGPVMPHGVNAFKVLMKRLGAL